MKNQLTYLVLSMLIVFGNAILVAAQTPNEEIKTGRLLKRTSENGKDNYVYATYSFKFGGNGPEIQKLCRNNWDLLFGNSSLNDAFDVTMVTDDRSRIKDLGRYKWEDKFNIPTLAAYEEPEHEDSVKAIEGHMYMVHSRDRDSNHYALFRVEKLTPGESVDISWKLISPPKRY
ncbi:MAG TPA: hypothetical protein VHS05_09805 [Pyrinomonadaceae bacterium]|nr:hypothetical protein [Pyrinomonadaceae bacterium]